MRNDPQSSSQTELSSFDFGIVVRLIGVGIVFVGISVAYKVVTTAWDLFEDSTKIIGPLSETIEEHSNINQFVQTLTKQSNHSFFSQQRKSINQTVTPAQEVESPTASQSATTSPEAEENKDVKFTYFAAWGIVLVLLGIVSRIGVSLIGVGGSIAADNVRRKEVSSLIKQLAKEIKATNT